MKKSKNNEKKSENQSNNRIIYSKDEIKLLKQQQTIKDLMYYCLLEKPVGAILLAGEWGAGKTFLIEHQLRSVLEETCIILRISLFGVASVADVHRAVKAKWIDYTGGIIKYINKIQEKVKQLKDITKAIPDNVIQNSMDTLINLDYSSFSQLKNIEDNKNVILVFDDLERSMLNTVNLLGAINEYCENQSFHVIIIADEQKIKTSKSLGERISYDEIKEKVIQRTIYHEPEYKQIVSSLIRTIKKEKYMKFLQSKEAELIALFAGVDMNGTPLSVLAEIELQMNKHDTDRDNFFQKEEEAYNCCTNRPHNIRSLKIAIQEFERIYDIICEYKYIDAGKWLLTFVSYSMAARAAVFCDEEISETQIMKYMYPTFYSYQLMPEHLKLWVKKGIWKEEEFKKEIEEQYNEMLFKPETLVKNMHIDYIDEAVVRRGIPIVIHDAYDGKLSFNQYINLIRNASIARYYGLELPSIDWKRVQKGIEHRKTVMIENKETEENEFSLEKIDKGSKYKEIEIKTYELIEDIRKRDLLYYEKNRREYIEGIISNPIFTFHKAEENKCNRFDYEMAWQTYKAYEKADISTKPRFPRFMKSIWGTYFNKTNIRKLDKETTVLGFTALKNNLKPLIKIYANEPFKRKFTEALLQTIDDILDKSKDNDCINREIVGE